jgi:hypothetical protein
MSGATVVDVRGPIGVLFAAMGLILAVYGAVAPVDAERYPSTGAAHINLWWGLVMLCFGAFLLILAARSRRKSAPISAELSPEGRSTEEREHQLGLEK